MRCPACGTKVPATASACVTCWTPLPASGARPVITGVAMTPRRHSRRRTRRTVIVILALLVAGLSVAAAIGQPWARTGLLSTRPTGGVTRTGSWPAAGDALSPYAVAVAGAGQLVIDDQVHHIVLLANLGQGPVTLYGRTIASGRPAIVVGTGTPGDSGDGGPATRARLDSPEQLAVDSAGNLFIADTQNNRIRRVDVTTGIITTVAGTGSAGYGGDGGPATQARLFAPFGVAVDGTGTLFIADTSNEVVRRVDGSTGVITTIAGVAGHTDVGTRGGSATGQSLLNSPTSLTLYKQRVLLIVESYRIQGMDVADSRGLVQTVVGTGMPGYSGDGGAAMGAEVFGLANAAVDAAGNLDVTDAGNNVVRRIDGSTGVITTVAGDMTASEHHAFGGDGGPALGATFRTPTGIAVDSAGNLYIADTGNHRVREMAAHSGVITTIVGPDAPRT